MKNDLEMYQSVLSKRNEHRKKKEKQLRIIKRTLPVLACFCLTLGLWAAFRERPEKLPEIPDTPGIIETTTTVTAVTSSTAVNISTSAATAASALKTTLTASTVTGQTTKTTAAVTETPAVTQTEQTTAQQTETQISSTNATVTSAVTSTANDSCSVTTTFGDMSINPIPPDKPIYPLLFDDMEAAVNAVLNPDMVLAYDDAEASAVYSGMFGRFRDEGFIYRVLENKNIEILDGNGILLHPSTQREDIGVSYLVKYKDNNYRVRFFSVDQNISGKTKGIAEYLKERTGREETMSMSMNGQYITIYTTDQRQWFMSAFIDSGHYFDISTLATVEDFLSFLTEFSYEKIDLEQ